MIGEARGVRRFVGRLLTMAARSHVLIAPQIFVPLDGAAATQTPELRRAEVPMTWTWDEGFGFRLDIVLPDSSTLDLVFPTSLSSLHVNGETIWADGADQPAHCPGVRVEQSPLGLRLTCTAAGPLHVLALGAVGAA